jgi:hypothetical protein
MSDQKTSRTGMAVGAGVCMMAGAKAGLVVAGPVGGLIGGVAGYVGGAIAGNEVGRRAAETKVGAEVKFEYKPTSTSVSASAGTDGVTAKFSQQVASKTIGDVKVSASVYAKQEKH